MPIVLRVKGYRFWFYEADLDEPPHVHIGKEGKEAKFWLNPVRLAKTRRFREEELSEIETILAEYRNDILGLDQGASETWSWLKLEFNPEVHPPPCRFSSRNWLR